MKKLRFTSFVGYAALLVHSGCQDTGTPAQSVAFTLDHCIAKVKVSVKPGAPESQEVSLTDGAGTAKFDKFDFDKEVEIRIEVLELAACEQNRYAKGDFLTYSGKMPASHALVATAFNNRYRPHTVSSGGSVAAGECPTSRGPGIGLYVSDANGCTKTCWQQWVRVRWFLVGSPDAELATGQPFPDSAGNQHEFGNFSRDKPDGSDGNCFRLDQIPGQPSGAKGIVDAPNFPDDANLFGFALRAVSKVKPGTRPPFSIRYEFEVRSVLWCAAPQSKILGYYSWNAKQTFDFATNPNPQPKQSAVTTTRHPSEVDKNAVWKDGSNGLEGPMKQY
jgi:hypothetical protein